MGGFTRKFPMSQCKIPFLGELKLELSLGLVMWGFM